MNAFFHALAFFSRIPVPWLKPSEEAWKKSVAWYPAVGFVLGVLLWGAHVAGVSLFGPMLGSVLALAFWVYITGGLHLDGWMDLADGLGSSRPREQVLEIMKDSRVGAMGVLAAILLLLIKGAALAQLASPGASVLLLVVLAASRTHVLLSIRCFPYASAKGLGKGIGEGLSPAAIVIGYAAVLSVGWFVGSWQAICAILVSFAFTIWFSRSVARKLGGLTGDCYGAVIESNEAVMLIVLAGSWWS